LNGTEAAPVQTVTSTRPWLPEILSTLALASGVGYVATAYAVSRRLTRPTPARPARTPGDYSLPWEDLRCRTGDGLVLAGWAVSPPDARATVVLFHGLRRTREHLLWRVAFLAGEGCRCVAFDHRAHGESAGRKTSFGFHESRDVTAVFDLVRERWPDQPRFALGMSMGAAALCFAAEQLGDCDGVILESLYHDLAGAFANRIGSHYPPWFRRLSYGVIWLTERRLGMRLAQASPANYIGGFGSTPVLLVTGEDDPHATPADARRLFERCRGPRDLWLVPGARHGDVFEVGGAAYQDRLRRFLRPRLARLAA
jgi:alpha-beta hydrolase superfamily lysophospholipase